MVQEQIRFIKKLDEFKLNVEKRADQAFRNVSYEILENLVAHSPVLTGNFRAHWRVTRNKPSSVHFPGRGDLWWKERKTTAIPRSAIEVWTRGEAVIARIKFGDTVYFTNNTEYAEELAEGSSSQAPPGWIPAVVSRNLKSLRGSGFFNKIGRV